MIKSTTCLKVTLDDVTPTVMRRIEVPFDIRLDRLHLVLQTALGWTNSHLYEFRIADVGFGIPDPEWGDGPLDARKATLKKVIADTDAKTFKYLYDFGDGWEHSIKIERILPAIPGLEPVNLIEAIGRCPPEDIGGAGGYQEFLEAIVDPEHERRSELKRWWGSASFNSNTINSHQIENALHALAKKWRRKPKT